MNGHPVKHPPLHTKAEVVEDILKHMEPDDKATLKDTSEDELILLHHEWGRYLRNYYGMWRNQELLQDIGEEHPDDASGVVIQEVWQRLQTEK